MLSRGQRPTWTGLLRAEQGQSLHPAKRLATDAMHHLQCIRCRWMNEIGRMKPPWRRLVALCLTAPRGAPQRDPVPPRQRGNHRAPQQAQCGEPQDNADQGAVKFARKRQAPAEEGERDRPGREQQEQAPIERMPSRTLADAVLAPVRGVVRGACGCREWRLTAPDTKS